MCEYCHSDNCTGTPPDADTQFLLAQGYQWDCARGIAWRKQGTLFVLFQRTCHIVRNVTTLDEALVQLAIDQQQREKWTIMWTPGRCAPQKPHGNVDPQDGRFMGGINSND